MVTITDKHRAAMTLAGWISPEVAKSINAAIRTAVADYMRSEGCSCCRDEDAHRAHAAKLAGLLGVERYPAPSDEGFNFAAYRTKG